MSIAWLNGMGDNAAITKAVESGLQSVGEDYKHLDLMKMDIKPCRNCGGCNYKTPGKCVVKDDTDTLMKALVYSDRYLILTSVSFGSYNSSVKKAMDKMSLTGLPIFISYKGRLQHPHRYEALASQSNLVVAVLDHNTQLEKESFEKLVKANATIMMCDIKLLFVEADEKPEDIKIKLTRLLKEASL